MNYVVCFCKTATASEYNVPLDQRKSLTNSSYLSDASSSTTAHTTGDWYPVIVYKCITESEHMKIHTFEMQKKE